MSLNSVEGEEDPLLQVGPVGEQQVDRTTSSVLGRMRAVLHTIESEEVQATVAIPHDKEEYFDDKPPVPSHNTRHLRRTFLIFQEFTVIMTAHTPNFLSRPMGKQQNQTRKISSPASSSSLHCRHGSASRSSGRSLDLASSCRSPTSIQAISNPIFRYVGPSADRKR
jgi:hypothetical protein